MAGTTHTASRAAHLPSLPAAPFSARRLPTSHPTLIRFSAPLFLDISFTSFGLSLGRASTYSFVACMGKQARLPAWAGTRRAHRRQGRCRAASVCSHGSARLLTCPSPPPCAAAPGAAGGARQPAAARPGRSGALRQLPAGAGGQPLPAPCPVPCPVPLAPCPATCVRCLLGVLLSRRPSASLAAPCPPAGAL